MPLDILDFFGGILDLLQLLLHWRFWLCVLVAIGIAWPVHQQIDDFGLRWALSFGIVIAGMVAGIVWDLKR